MKLYFCYLLLLVVTNKSAIAGGLLGDMLNQIAPGTGTSLDKSHDSIKNSVPVYKHLEENSTDSLRPYEEISRDSMPPPTEINPSLEYRSWNRMPEYSYVCMTPYGSCPINAYGLSGSACYCSTPYGVYYGISQ